MKTLIICFAAVVAILETWPASAQVWVEEEIRRPPRVVERDVIVREPGWGRPYAWAGCRTVVERRYRPDGTTFVRKIRRCR
jgi:hypothetical protein